MRDGAQVRQPPQQSIDTTVTAAAAAAACTSHLPHGDVQIPEAAHHKLTGIRARHGGALAGGKEPDLPHHVFQQIMDGTYHNAMSLPIINCVAGPGSGCLPSGTMSMSTQRTPWRAMHTVCKLDATNQHNIPPKQSAHSARMMSLARLLLHAGQH